MSGFDLETGNDGKHQRYAPQSNQCSVRGKILA
jgi:hypothetical protein